MEDLKQKLMNGEEIFLTNENTNFDDFRGAECSFVNNVGRNQWANGFKIDFNGQLFSFKTFGAFEKKLNQLIKDWKLEESVNLETA